jgi:hypothetical protein
MSPVKIFEAGRGGKYKALIHHPLLINGSSGVSPVKV